MAGRSWQVTGIATNQVIVGAAGNPVEGSIIYYLTGEGVEGSVFIPQTELSVPRAHTAIDSDARKLDTIRRLQFTET